VASGSTRFNLDIERTDERYSIGLNRDGGSSSVTLVFAPALPLDANVWRVTVGGRQHPFTIEREGNIQRVRVAIEQRALQIRLDITHDAGTDVDLQPASSRLQWRHSGRDPRDRQGRAQTISISFPGSPNDYVRRDLRLPLK
jgi:hypothetical protein